MKKIELLAPAKDKACAFAAIDFGADAVYIGAPGFGARHAAGNTFEDIRDIVSYAHKFYARVYAAVNTILDDTELLQAKEMIRRLYELGVDALIVQDMGIFEMAKNDADFPPLALFASTQCDNRDLAKVRFFEEAGAQRVILARELSLEAIREICAKTRVEIETFIHGALCVSYSGQCYLSYAIGGRSANRGECAQPCRMKYSLVDDEGKVIAQDAHLLSLKDFNASGHIRSLVDAGVASFKIEGRLKDASYVKNSVGFYRKLLDAFTEKTSSGTVFFDFEPDVDKSFNREWTDYFLNGRRKDICSCATPQSLGEKIGVVTKVDKLFFEYRRLPKSELQPLLHTPVLHPQDGLCFFSGGALRGCLVNRVDGNRVYVHSPDKSSGKGSGEVFGKASGKAFGCRPCAGLSVNDEIYRNFDAEFTKKIEASRTRRRIRVNIEFKSDMVSALDEDGNIAQLGFATDKTAKNTELMYETVRTQFGRTGESDFFVDKIEFNFKTAPPFFGIAELNQMRRDLLEKLMSERLANYKTLNAAKISYTQYTSPCLDYRANVYNEKARKFYAECGAQVVEKAFETDKTHAKNNKILMTARHCLKYTFNMCKSSKKLYLVDTRGVRYDLLFDCDKCEMSIK